MNQKISIISRKHKSLSFLSTTLNQTLYRRFIIAGAAVCCLLCLIVIVVLVLRSRRREDDDERMPDDAMIIKSDSKNVPTELQPVAT